MKESCYCGRYGDIEDRRPVFDPKGRRALQCPDCGHTDHLGWLSEESSLRLWKEAERRQLTRYGQPDESTAA